MLELSDILNAARRRGGFRSDRALSRHLGLNPVCINQFRNKRAMPSDVTMLRISRVAGLDDITGLMLINIWRSKDIDHTTYMDIAARLGVDLHDKEGLAA